MSSNDHGVGLSEPERAALTRAARERLARFGWFFAAFAALSLTLMVVFVLVLASRLPPDRSPARLWTVGLLVVGVLTVTFGAPFLTMRRRLRNPDLLLGADRQTQAAVQRALRDGHSDDPRVDALARASAQRQLNALRGQRRLLAWIFPVAAVLVLTGLALMVIADGLSWNLLPSLIVLAVFGWITVHHVRYVPRCRRYLDTAPAGTGPRQ